MRPLRLETQMNVSRKGAKGQSTTGGRFGLRRSLRSACFSGPTRVFAPLREIRPFHGAAIAILIIVLLSFTSPPVSAQSPTVTPSPTPNPVLSRYLDQTSGTTADSAVAYALAHNGELEAARKELDAAPAMVKQARLRANPKLAINGIR